MELDSRNRVIILSLGVLLVLFVAFFILGNIWTSNTSNNTSSDVANSNTNTAEIKQNEEKILGNIYNVNDGEERMLKEYFSDLFKALSSSDKERIYSMTSDYYLKKYNLNIDSLYRKLQEKGMVGKAFECKQYSKADNQRFGRIYSLEISSIDGKVVDKVIVIEESPRNFKVSYDAYIGKVSQDISLINEGLRLDIVSVEEFKDVVYMQVALQNTTDDIMILNRGKNAEEAIYVNLNANTKIFNTDTFFDSQEIELKPGQRITHGLQFFISDLQSYKINKIVVVNVYNDTSKTNQNYEYSIYN